MVDIEQYRSRIGSFCGGRHSSYCGLGTLNSSLHASPLIKFSFCLTFLIIIGLAYPCSISDPGIEKNPGPWESEISRKLYFSLKKITTDIARVSCHRFFIVSCIRLDLTPSGLNNLRIPVASCKPDQDLVNRITAAEKAVTKEVLSYIKEHYDKTLETLIADKNNALSELSKECSQTDYIKIVADIQNRLESESSSLMRNKYKKLNHLIDNQSQKSTNIWLPDLQLTENERAFLLSDTENICDGLINAAIVLLTKMRPFVDIQSPTLPIEHLHYSPHESIHIHHIGNHFATSSSIGNKVIVYDSLRGDSLNETLLNQLSALYSPDPSISPTVLYAKMAQQQHGSNDCGLFAIAYATDLLLGRDPSQCVYDQYKMRGHLHQCLEARELTPFPKTSISRISPVLEDVTNDVPPNRKWSTPSKTAKHYKPKSTPPVSTHNRYSNLSENPVKKIHQPHPQISSSVHSPRSRQRSSKNQIIYNISHRTLTEAERSVIELGLSFCPSQKELDKNQLTDDLFQFIRKLKLREFFDHNSEGDPSQESSPEVPQDDQQESDRAPSKWIRQNRDWFPNVVRNNRSAGLLQWIDKIKSSLSDGLRDNNQFIWNNLSNDQRKALKDLASDNSITIKPADKGGALVIMNTSDYDQASLQQLTNPEHYEEIPGDTTKNCRKVVNDLAAELHSAGHIDSFEHDTLRQGDRTSLYYGLPKIHKDYDLFPALRGICSGSDSPTVRLSEYVDSFLKPIAEKTLSYVRDTTDFINKTKNISITEGSTLVTMDVVSLYPNIDQEEGADACENALNNRITYTVPSELIKRLILTILKSNIMQFGTRFFLQIKGTAMGTPMAVNFANLFMNQFESEMLNSYEEQYGTRPSIWLRFIDDIFFVWEGDDQSLAQFIKFCDNYSTVSGKKSSIRFTNMCSKKEVNFLDMTVSLVDGRLVTDLYTKSVDTHSYLHAKSFHPPSLISSLPKTQFIRIRRICTNTRDYKRHANDFIQFFIHRGFRKDKLQRLADEIGATDRNSLLQPKRRVNENLDKHSRVVLSLKWHPRLRFLPKLMHTLYDRFSTEYPSLKRTFVEPPIVAFRKNRTIRDILVRAKSTPTPLQHQTNVNQGASARFSLSSASTLTNVNTGVTVNTINSQSSVHDCDVVYAAECTRCHQLYVGQTKQKLFLRFTGHRSDTANHPDRCELPLHFHESSSGCNFDTDLQIHVLQKGVTGSRAAREAEEDKWILKLGCLSPNGLNAKLSDYGCLYKDLF